MYILGCDELVTFCMAEVISLSPANCVVVVPVV
jgi:hypothetical protein